MLRILQLFVFVLFSLLFGLLVLVLDVLACVVWVIVLNSVVWFAGLWTLGGVLFLSLDLTVLTIG